MNRSTWAVVPVRASSVAALIRGNHYLHRMPGVVPCAMAVEVDGWVKGALVWALPPMETAKRYGGVTWELARLWLADELPFNSESWVIGRAIKHVRREHPEIKFLVSYADPAAGHRGTIYMATNWRYEGLTDAERKTPRFDYVANGRRIGRASHGVGMLVEKVRRQPKHRFSMALERSVALERVS